MILVQIVIIYANMNGESSLFSIPFNQQKNIGNWLEQHRDRIRAFVYPSEAGIGPCFGPRYPILPVIFQIFFIPSPDLLFKSLGKHSFSQFVEAEYML